MKEHKITKRKRLWSRFMSDIYYKCFFTRLIIVFCLLADWDLSYKKLYVRRFGDRSRSQHSWRKITQILWIRFRYAYQDLEPPKRRQAIRKILKGNRRTQKKRARQERKRVLSSGQQKLTTDKTKIKEKERVE